MPFALSQRNANCTHNGMVDFLFNSEGEIRDEYRAIDRSPNNRHCDQDAIENQFPACRIAHFAITTIVRLSELSQIIHDVSIVNWPLTVFIGRYPFAFRSSGRKPFSGICDLHWKSLNSLLMAHSRLIPFRVDASAFGCFADVKDSLPHYFD